MVDATRESRVGLTACSLAELDSRVREKFQIEQDIPIRVVLESDGTEIDEDDYFLTMDPDTALMILCGGEGWTPYKAATIPS